LWELLQNECALHEQVSFDTVVGIFWHCSRSLLTQVPARNIQLISARNSKTRNRRTCNDDVTWAQRRSRGVHIMMWLERVMMWLERVMMWLERVMMWLEYMWQVSTRNKQLNYALQEWQVYIYIYIYIM
jgi:hypothetical protein